MGTNDTDVHNPLVEGYPIHFFESARAHTSPAATS